MSKEKRYIGISFGPITRVLNYANSTRSIWASSYLFSYLAKQTVSKYYKPRSDKESKGFQNRTFLTPFMNDIMFTKIDGVGRFPDHYVFKALEEDTIDNVRNHVNQVLSNLASNIRLALMKKGIKDDVKIITTYLQNTLRVLIFEKSYRENVKDGDIIKDMQQAMAIMECRDTFCSKETRNYLASYLESTSKYSVLTIEAEEGKDNNNQDGRLFTTILECSVGSDISKYKKFEVFDKSTNETSEIELTYDGLLKNLEENANNLKPYQKYIAFVSADGDNFGKTLARKSNVINDQFMNFYDQLNARVKAYGGQVIYQGGDDIFFFAPVFNSFKENNDKDKDETYNWDIFQLVESIDEIFKDTIGNLPELQELEENLRPSLSYGIAIAYYKFPMFETKVASENLLESIKRQKNKEKNKIAWSVRKHSGHTFKDVVNKNNEDSNPECQSEDKVNEKESETRSDFSNCLKLIKAFISHNKDDSSHDKDGSSQDKDGITREYDFLHSVTYWVKLNEPMLITILTEKKEEGNTDYRRDCLANFFENNFNEKVHKKYSDLLKEIQNFMLFYEKDEGINKLHAVMRYISLLIKNSDK